MPKRSERSTTRRSPDEVRALLLDAARQEFGAHGYSGTTSRDIAATAGVALSVLYRHFESKADLFSDAMLEPFVQAFERLGDDWLRQLEEPLPDLELMQVFLRDVYTHLTTHQQALDLLSAGRSELSESMLERIRQVFERLLTQVGVMTQLEANRRDWMAQDGIDMSLRMLMSMMLGLSTYGWMLLPGGDKDASSDAVLSGLSRFGLWGMARPPHTAQQDLDD